MESIHRAAYEGDVEEVRRLLMAGENVNAIATDARDTLGMTPLHFAAWHGHRAVAEVLLASGADMEARTCWGVTPLAVAAGEGNSPEVVQLLLSRGAEVNVRDSSGRTPLWIAAIRGNLAVVKILAGGGADINASDEDGLTPLRVARPHEQVFEFLRSLGARTGRE